MLNKYLKNVSLKGHKIITQGDHMSLSSPAYIHARLTLLGIFGRLARVQQDWCLKTAASYGPFVHIRVICDVDHGWWYWLWLTPNLSTRALWQPPVLSGGPVSRDISVAAPSTGWFPAIRYLWQPPVMSGFLPSETSLERVGGGESKWEFSVSVPMGLQEFFYIP
jgi:hypothetical protein